VCECVCVCVTHRHAVVGLRLPVGEVAHRPGHVVRGHARRTREAVGHAAVLVRRAALQRHVSQAGVLRVVAQRQGERGLVGRLVEAREGLPRVDGTELGHRQVPGGGTGGTGLLLNGGRDGTL